MNLNIEIPLNTGSFDGYAIHPIFLSKIQNDYGVLISYDDIEAVILALIEMQKRES